MIACILCGGVGEVMLVMAGFTWLLKWFRKRHDRKKCKCCQSHEEDLQSYLKHKGYSDDIAKNIDYAYITYGYVGVEKVAKELKDDKHDYSNEFFQDVKDWQTVHFTARRYGEVTLEECRTKTFEELESKYGIKDRVMPKRRFYHRILSRKSH